ncbi:MAG TPA: FliM/FliN family flagellar motor switch protein [Ramlibacter sp.]|uniref:FliM/FliN family flagellar motor switch protein n=1 Tax=Ramlibacter sp. TaxID=1917967 RepID=UPI002CDBE4B6|nr:FliM/FliN family flagellar motor switch protein [Ramlibacter sp.]HVZ46114.1 FliM/FliN family flagellar motor switch protein [Ramlibacter sp.]
MNQDTASIRILPAGNPPTAQVISLTEVHGEPGRPVEGAALAVTSNPLHAVRARLQVRVGEVELTVGELMAAKEHEVLVLDRTIDEAVDLMLEGQVVARGELVAMDGRFALRITELPLPLKP